MAMLFLAYLFSFGGLLQFSEAQSSAGKGSSENTAQTTQHKQHSLQSERTRAEQKVRPEVEQKSQEARQEAQKSLDSEAIAAIQDTQNAIQAISSNKTDEALAAIERATGKINVLLARKPSNGLIPVDFEVDVIDNAPADSNAILEIAKDASKALDSKDYPTARVLLAQLMSEIRVKTYNLPLATYPDALKQAAKLLDQKKTQDASNVLLTALNTLVEVDRVTPIPIVVAQTAISKAQAERQKDKNAALTYVNLAKTELQRAKELGYSSNEPEYAALNNSLSDLEKQLNGNGNTESAFAKLKNEIASFINKESNRARR
jgi:hypothetical protein